jgi:hypothetical protein
VGRGAIEVDSEQMERWLRRLSRLRALHFVRELPRRSPSLRLVLWGIEPPTPFSPVASENRRRPSLHLALWISSPSRDCLGQISGQPPFKLGAEDCRLIAQGGARCHPCP